MTDSDFLLPGETLLDRMERISCRRCGCMAHFGNITPKLWLAQHEKDAPLNGSQCRTQQEMTALRDRGLIRVTDDAGNLHGHLGELARDHGFNIVRGPAAWDSQNGRAVHGYWGEPDVVPLLFFLYPMATTKLIARKRRRLFLHLAWAREQRRELWTACRSLAQLGGDPRSVLDLIEATGWSKASRGHR